MAFCECRYGIVDHGVSVNLAFNETFFAVDLSGSGLELDSFASESQEELDRLGGPGNAYSGFAADAGGLKSAVVSWDRALVCRISFV